MAIFSLSEVLDYFKDDMARNRGQSKVADTDDRLLNGYVDQLVRAVDKPSSDAVLESIRDDKRLSVGDVATIALRYNKGGKKPASKKAALAAIAKRALEIRHFHAKNRVAEKARPW
jgi:predicted amino acid racemase